jgi:hypothetical protein
VHFAEADYFREGDLSEKNRSCCLNQLTGIYVAFALKSLFEAAWKGEMIDFLSEGCKSFVMVARGYDASVQRLVSYLQSQWSVIFTAIRFSKLHPINHFVTRKRIPARRITDYQSVAVEFVGPLHIARPCWVAGYIDVMK